VSEARKAAGDGWQAIVGAATIELRGLAQRLVLIVEGAATGQLSRDSAARHFAAARFHVIATIAMLTVMIEATVERVINAALAAIKQAVNTAIGFPLIV
jgi:hypothetical protein